MVEPMPVGDRDRLPVDPQLSFEQHADRYDRYIHLKGI
jgi:hypothetical protein